MSPPGRHPISKRRPESDGQLLRRHVKILDRRRRFLKDRIDRLREDGAGPRVSSYDRAECNALTWVLERADRLVDEEGGG